MKTSTPTDRIAASLAEAEASVMLEGYDLDSNPLYQSIKADLLAGKIDRQSAIARIRDEAMREFPQQGAA